MACDLLWNFNLVPRAFPLKIKWVGREKERERTVDRMLRVSELHWWEGRHPQCCTTFSSIVGAQHQPQEEKEGRSHKTPSLLECQDFCLRRLPAQEED